MHQIIRQNDFVWVDIKGPTKEDLKFLNENFALHPLVLNEIMPHLDYPKAERFGDYLFVVLFYPSFNSKTSTLIPLELDIIVSKNYIITNHFKDIAPLKYIFDKCNLYEDQKEVYMQKGPGELLYHIIRKILSASFPKLSEIKKNFDRAEIKAHKQKKYAQAVFQIADIQRDIVNFQKIIEPHKIVLENIARESSHIFDKSVIPYFNHLQNIYRQVKAISESQSKAIDYLSHTNEALLTTRTNEIIKVLTIFSVVVFPMTFLANFFGMNIETLPFSFLQEQQKILFVLGLMGLGTIAFLLYFTRKKWR